MQSLLPGVTRRVPILASLFCVIIASTGAGPAPVALPTGRVEGQVKDGAGRPLANAQVLAVGTAFNALTDSQGGYAIPALPAGRITLRAALIGYQPVEQSVTVRAGSTVRQDFSLAGISLERREAANAKSARVGLALDEAVAIGATAQAMPSAAPALPRPEPWRWPREPGNTEAYARIEENRVALEKDGVTIYLSVK